MRRGVLFLINLLAVPPDSRTIQDLRCGLTRFIGARIGGNSQLSEHFYIYDGRNFRMGAKCTPGAFCRIWDFFPITIGDKLLASHGLTLISGTHLLNETRTERPGPISIGHNVWIGINVTIVGPATIGDGVVIGANSLVMGTLDSYAVYAGSPAKLIRRLDAVESEDLRHQGKEQ
jgi:acetyltransferase-like isoleucine patch superfamily enzyme